MPPSFTLSELQTRLGGAIKGDAELRLQGVASLSGAATGHLSFVVGSKHLEAARASRAAALIAPRDMATTLDRPMLLVDNPHAAFARAAALFHPEPQAEAGIHPSACIDPSAMIDSQASIGAHVHVGANCQIGSGSRIDANSVIGADCVIGNDCHLHPNVTLYAASRLGNRVQLHSGCVIGADGFGLAREGEAWIKVPQIGGVILGDDVEVGANTTIDRGALEDTLIEPGVKIDNLVQIAHNCRIGAHTAIAGCVGIAGSTRIGRHCLIGGAAMIIGHLDITDAVTVSAGTFIAKSIDHPGVYTSTQPQMPHSAWRQNAAQLRHLAEMRDRVRALEKQLAALENHLETTRKQAS